MNTAFRNIAAGFVLLTAAASGAAHAGQNSVTPQGQWLAHELDRMGVETKWIAGSHINWKTGLPDGEAETMPGRHTHCNAFRRLRRGEVRRLHSPAAATHSQALLANAQNEWLAIEGRAEGWHPLGGPAEAQERRQSPRMLVVASYHNHRDDKPGHIAIVRPSDKSAEKIAEEGPDVIQAATVNSSSISVKAGFAEHVYAWGNNEINYYAHAIKMPESISNN